MNAVRDALTAMWCQERSPQRLLPMIAKDLVALLGSRPPCWCRSR